MEVNVLNNNCPHHSLIDLRKTGNKESHYAGCIGEEISMDDISKVLTTL